MLTTTSFLQGASGTACYEKPRDWRNSILCQYTGSSSVESLFRTRPHVPSFPMFPGGIFGCGYGYGYINGGWNNGLYTFADIIDNRQQTSFWDCFSAGIKEQLYTNPFGTMATGVQVGAVGLGILGNLCNALANFGNNQNA